MITFIIRRLLTAIFLLIVVSMITFGIFFLIPRLAGQNAYELAAQYVGRNPTQVGDPPDGGQARPQRVAARPVLALPVRDRGRRALQRRPERDVLPAAVLRLLVPQPAARLAADGRRAAR